MAGVRGGGEAEGPRRSPEVSQVPRDGTPRGAARRWRFSGSRVDSATVPRVGSVRAAEGLGGSRHVLER